MRIPPMNRNRIFASAGESVIRRNLADLRSFVEHSEHLLEKEGTSLSRRMNKQARRLPPSRRNEVVDWFDEEIHNLQETFPRIQRYSIFVLLMGTIEHELNWICECARRAWKTDLKDNDLAGHGIYRSVDYLTKVCQFRIAKDATSPLQYLITFQQLRNVIIHNGGHIKEEERKRFEAYRTHNPHFTVSASGNIVLTDQFLYAVIQTAQDFVLILFAQIWARIEADEKATGVR